MQLGQMRLGLAAIAAFLPLLEAKPQQVAFSLRPRQAQIIVPQHHQPWSILLSQNPNTADCIVLSQPAQAQFHKSINNAGDVLMVNKTLSSTDGFEIINEYVVEIIGYDQRILWQKTSELCSAINYQYPTEVDPLAEFEVVYLQSIAEREKITLLGRSSESNRFCDDVHPHHPLIQG
jgi:hypothetical protein